MTDISVNKFWAVHDEAAADKAMAIPDKVSAALDGGSSRLTFGSRINDDVAIRILSPFVLV